MNEKIYLLVSLANTALLNTALLDAALLKGVVKNNTVSHHFFVSAEHLS